jgi:hypothetical protein
MDLQEMQIVAQLLDNMELATNHLEKAFGKSDSTNYKRASDEIFDIQSKIDRILK